MHDDDESLEPAAAVLAEAAGEVSKACQVLTVQVVGAHRAGVPLARIAQDSGVHPIVLRDILAAAGEPLAPAWPDPGGRPQAVGRDGDRGMPIRLPGQSARGAGAEQPAGPDPGPYGSTVVVVLLGGPGRFGGMVMLYHCPRA